MDRHVTLNVIACSGNLAFAILVWFSRGTSRVAFWLSLLFLDAFIWNFADTAYNLSGVEQWHAIDRIFASLMPALALHVVISFVGRAQRLRSALFANYALFAATAAIFWSEQWWRVLLAAALVAMMFALWLLLSHRRAAREPSERSRTSSILLAFALGTLLSVTDLLTGEIAGVDIPRLGNLGTLLCMVLLAAATLRWRLLGTDVPLLLAVYVLPLGALCALSYIAIVRWLSPMAALLFCSITSLGVISFAATRELKRVSAVGRERSRRLSLLGRLSDQLAHDLRNPLAALKGALQFLAAERAAGRSLDEQADYLELMLEQVERVERTVQQYQRMARVEPLLRTGSLNQVIESVVRLQQFATPGIAVRSELQQDLPLCRLDSDLLAAALENLVRNACEAMPGGGTVTVSSLLSGAPAELRVRVEDTGVGMDTRELERATEEFYTTKAGGSGLGLSFARRVARAHAGELKLESEPGKGTVVELSIPVADLEYSMLA